MKKIIPGIPARKLKKLKMVKPPKPASAPSASISIDSSNSYYIFASNDQKKPA